jgi:hypothetical protein
MTTMWIAMQFGSSDSNDPAVFNGVFSDKDKAIDVMDKIFTDPKTVKKILGDGTISYEYGKRETILGQIFSAEVDEPTAVEV